MSEIIVNTEYCKGCGYCIDVCPVGCITFSEAPNKSGYQFIKVNKDDCIKCGSCYTVCPDSVYEIIE